MLALVAGVIGLIFALWATSALVALIRPICATKRIHVEGSVLQWFTLGVTLLTGLLFGLAPALRISRGETMDSPARRRKKPQRRRASAADRGGGAGGG